MPTTVHDCWFLTGATASGKTSVALHMAERLNAEIISMDSMAIYRDMNIGTAKPTCEEQARIDHHLIDIVDPVDEYSVSQYVDAANRLIEQISGRGRDVLFVGGTPLYLKSLLRGIFEGPPADWEFREQVEAEVKRVGNAALHERLQQVDPLSAARLHPNDVRRIIRALEVYKITGEPISHQQTQFDEGLSADQCKVFALSWPRETLHQRIEARVEGMFAAGLVDEVRGLMEKYAALGRTASQAVGYCEVIDHLGGERDLSGTIDQVKTRTRQFSKRQETWFRSLSECREFQMDGGECAEEVAKQIIATIN